MRFCLSTLKGPVPFWCSFPKKERCLCFHLLITCASTKIILVVLDDRFCFLFHFFFTISCLMKRVISCFNVALLSFKTLLMFKTARLPSNACSLHRFPELQLNRCSFLDSRCFCLFKKCVIWELSFQMLWVTWTGLFLRWPNVHCMSCHLFVLSKKCKKNKIKNPMKNKINLNKLCENPIKLLTDVMVKKWLFSWCFKSMFAVLFNASFQYRL